MTGKLIKKLLSVVLVAAICVGTVFGCLIAVDAADTAATYTITAETLHAYADEGKATITFDLGSGFTGGSFTLLKDNISYSTNYDKEGKLIAPSPWNYEYRDVEIKAVSGIKADGSALTSDDLNNIKIINDTNYNGKDDATEEGDVSSPNNSLWFNKEKTAYKDADGNAFVYDPSENVDTTYRWDKFRFSDISFESVDTYKSLTFELTFEWDYCMQPNSKNEIIFAQADQYDYRKDEEGNNIAYSAPVLKNGENSYTLTENNPEGNINYFHSHSSEYININTQLVQQNDYGIYTGTCQHCGAVSNQVLSDVDGFKPNAYYDIAAINITYEDDGSVSLNAHCPGFRSEKEKLVISYSDGKKTVYGDIVDGKKTSEIAGNSNFNVSPYAKVKKTNEETGNIYYDDSDGRIFPADTRMYEIKGLSAKDIESKFYLTRVVEGDAGTEFEGKLFCGNTEEVSLKDYCVDVVNGDKVYYPEGVTSDQKDADKMVAAAFINYCVAAANALNHKVVYENEVITSTDTWTGDHTQPQETDEAGNIIINTPEELAWVALYGGADTAGKTYKVADNQVFDMNGFEGITPYSTAADLKTATATGTKWYNAGVCDWNSTNTYTSFQGNFDGNGVIIYNLNAFGSNHAGLFPQIRSVNNSLKNIYVKASAFKGINIGGIVGNAYNNGNDIVINGSAVENCYFYSSAAQTERLSAGAFVGFSEHMGIAIDNCYAANNEFDATSLKYYGGFIGDVTKWGNAVSFSNSISIGSSPFPVVREGVAFTTDTRLGNTEKCAWNNVYSDTATPDSAFENAKSGISVLTTTEMTGSAAKDNMAGLDFGFAWVAGETDEYPSLNPELIHYDEWDGTLATGFAGGTGAEDDPYIIATAEQLAFLVRGAGSTTTESTTRYKYYKIADGIKYFNMNGFTNITLNSSVDDIDTAKANTANNWCNGLVSHKTQVFQGFFDGNGVVVYNVYASGKSAGLFPYANGDINASTEGDQSASVKYPLKIENVTVKNSYFTSTSDGAGGILGSHQNFYRSGIIINNCAVDNCSFDTTSGATGAFIGDIKYDPDTTINHCLAVENKFTKNSQEVIGSLIGKNANGNQKLTLNNSVVIGATPYTSGNTGLSTSAKFTNVYTTESTASLSGITTLTAAQMQGANAVENMPLLNWGCDWFEGKSGEYPSFEGEVYADIWDGTKAPPSDRDNDGIIDITTAEELAWIALEGATATQGKNYKVADGIKYFNMNGMSGISMHSTAAEVKTATKSTTNIWRQAGDNAKTYAFGGNFDGNGVIVYNVYSGAGNGHGYSGLFPTLVQSTGTEITIKNVQVMASYFVGYHGVGGVVGIANAQSTSDTAIFEKLTVKNCYLSDNNNSSSACQRTVSAIIGNSGHNTATVKNCIAVNNEISALNIKGGLVGNAGANSRGLSISDSIVIGDLAVSVDILDDDKPLQTAMINATYTNIYTDQTVDAAYTGIKTIDADDAKGEDAVETMPNLDWNGVWFTSKPGEYPCFADDGVKYVPEAIETMLIENKYCSYYSDFIANFESNYNRDTFESDAPGYCDLYTTGLTLKTNPYILITFAFQGDYWKNKEKITATFTVGDQTISVNGDKMINNEGAGRYHLVRLKEIDIANLCEDIAVTLSYNGETVGTGSISVAGFAFTAIDAGEEYEYYKKAAQAIVFYAKILQARNAAYAVQ